MDTYKSMTDTEHGTGTLLKIKTLTNFIPGKETIKLQILSVNWFITILCSYCYFYHNPRPGNIIFNILLSEKKKNSLLDLDMDKYIYNWHLPRLCSTPEIATAICMLPFYLRENMCFLDNWLSKKH